MDLQEALATHPDFASLSAEDRDLLGKAFTIDERPDRHEFIAEGGRPGAAWIVLSGTVVVTRERAPYQDELARVEPGGMFGLASLVAGSRRTATCRAEGPVRAARVDRFALDLLMRDHIPAAVALQRAVGRQLAHDYRNVADTIRKMLEARSAPA